MDTPTVRTGIRTGTNCTGMNRTGTRMITGTTTTISPPPGLLRALVPFGAAASPDLTILPVFLAAAALSLAVAIACVIVFAPTTIATFVSLTVLASLSSHRLRGDWIERHGDVLTGGVLVLIGGLVAAGLL